MTKLKLVLLFILVVILVDFGLENRLLYSDLKLFSFVLGRAPTIYLAYGCLALGLAVGWVGHALRIRKKRRQALPQEPQSQQSQEDAR